MKTYLIGGTLTGLLLLLVSGAFDVVIMVGALDPGFAPVSVVRELCQAAKPGQSRT